MPHRTKALPNKFKASPRSNTDQVYNVELEDHDAYTVSWNVRGSTLRGSCLYSGSVLKEIIYRDKAWEILDESILEELKLPEKFKFTSTLCGDSQKVWEAVFNYGDFSYKTFPVGQVFSAGQIKQYIEKGEFVIVEEPIEVLLDTNKCPDVKAFRLATPVTLEAIKKFCKDFPSVDVIIDSLGYHVIYGDCDTTFASTDEQLQQIMGAISVLESMKR